MALPYQRHQKLRIKQYKQNQKQNQVSLFDILKNKPFWIWNKQEHLKQAIETNQRCYFNLSCKCPTKDGNELSLFYYYEQLLYDSLIKFYSNLQQLIIHCTRW